MGILDNKIALITGGTTGIGFATAKRFLDEGATVLVTGRNPETLALARAELGDRVEVIQSDASDPDDIAALFTHVQAKHGRLDVLFLNAGIAKFAPWPVHTLADYDQMFAVNVRGPWLSIQAAIPVLSDGASVILTTSGVNTVGMAGASAYGATKAAVRSLVRTAAAELSDRNIRVNAVSPGPVETPIFGKMGMDEASLAGMAEHIKSQVPLGRFGAPDEIAEAALFLAGPGASFVQGIELVVDGGMTQI